MANLNKVMLMGNLTRDPELRVLPKGTQVCSFSIAINRKWKDEGGAEREEVTYVDIEAWGKTGENVNKFFSKGKPIFVEGRLKLEQWEDKNTKEKRSRMKVVVDGWQFIGGRDDASGASRPAPAAAAKPAAQESLDEDVPF